MKTIEDHFRDWENYAFGYSYDKGLSHIIPALRRFLELCYTQEFVSRSIDHAFGVAELEKDLTPTVAWFLINVLARAGILVTCALPEYGRLYGEGIRLRKFVLSRTDEELIKILVEYPSSYKFCRIGYGSLSGRCFCGPDFTETECCKNPFW